MLPVRLSRRARLAWPPGAVMVAAILALPWSLGSGKGSWEEPWATSHHSPDSWL